VRSLFAAALVLLAACGPSSDRASSSAAHDASAPASSTQPSLGPDPIVLRVARAGGLVRAYGYPRLDSALWSSAAPAPAIRRVLAFDDEAGSLAFVDEAGLPGRIDLRLGRVRSASKVKFAALASADGDAIYGVSKGTVTRLTPTSTWPYEPPVPASEVVPQPDGTVLVVAPRGDSTAIWRVRPPDPHPIDSTSLPRISRSFRTRVGDRVYFTVDSGLIGVSVRDLSPVPSVRFPTRVLALAPTPSGDRLFVANEESPTLSVIDRYRDRVAEEITLPGAVADLRMDPLGRYVLARPAHGDSIWVVAVATLKLLGSTRTRWLADLPFVAPDGLVALADANDVLFVDGASLEEQSRVPGGAKDFWYLIRWNGFRPRAAALDEPVSFARSDTVDSSIAFDSAFAGARVNGDSGSAATAAGGTDSGAAAAAQSLAVGFYVSFNAFLVESKAREAAAEIEVEGRPARVVATQRAGTPVYRVVMGPYATREEADRTGRASRRDFVVYEGVP